MSLDRAASDALKAVSTATITTILLKKGLRNVWLRKAKPLKADYPRIAGRVFTMRFVPAREDLATPASWSSPKSTRAAIEAMPADAIVVVDAMGTTDAGIFGDILCARMAKRGAAALITDGVVRDLAGVLGTGLPVWCQGAAAPPSVASLTFVNWQEPIACGGVAVFPDDVVVADADGAVLIPAALLDDGARRGARTGAHGSVDHGRGRQGHTAPRPLSDERGDQGALRGGKGQGLVHVAICGGGAIGTSIAYFLSRRGVDVTVVERTGVANAASGKSGGFLALDWCDGGPLEQLARRSFALHAELAETLPGDWGYRRMTTYGGYAGYSADAGNSPVDWVSDSVAIGRALGSTETTAQVNPAPFTQAMMRAAEAEGATLRVGAVTGLARDDGRVSGVVVDGETIAADATVIALGPWSILAAQWLPLPPVYGLKGLSLVFETGDRLPPEALFLEASDGAAHPEVFPRTDGTTYICGYRTEAPIPVDPAAVAPEQDESERFETICRSLSPVLRDAPIRARQACFRPVTSDGVPLIGPVPGIEGAYIAPATASGACSTPRRPARPWPN